MPDHETFIRQTFDLARGAAERGDRPFGSLLVVDGETVRTAQNSSVTDDDIASHPEITLARWAARNLDLDQLASATLYTSTEPCPMCAGAIYWSGLRRVVFSASSEDKAEFAGETLVMSCRDVFENGVDDVEVIGPVLHDEGRAVHADHW